MKTNRCIKNSISILLLVSIVFLIFGFDITLGAGRGGTKRRGYERPGAEPYDEFRKPRLKRPTPEQRERIRRSLIDSMQSIINPKEEKTFPLEKKPEQLKSFYYYLNTAEESHKNNDFSKAFKDYAVSIRHYSFLGKYSKNLYSDYKNLNLSRIESISNIFIEQAKNDYQKKAYSEYVPKLTQVLDEITNILNLKILQSEYTAKINSSLPPLPSSLLELRLSGQNRVLATKRLSKPFAVTEESSAIDLSKPEASSKVIPDKPKTLNSPEEKLHNQNESSINHITWGEKFEQIRQESISLLESGLSAQAQKTYLLALQDRNWPNARKANESIKQSKYASEDKKREADQTLRRIINHEAVNKMPVNSAVLDVQPIGEKIIIHIALKLSTKSTEFVGTFENFESLENITELQPIKRILITRNTEKRIGSLSNITKALPDKVIWENLILERAAANINELSREHLSPKDFMAAILLPRNERQKERLGLTNWTKQEQIQAWQAAEDFLKSSGITEIPTKRSNRGGLLGWLYDKFNYTRVYENLMETLPAKKGVLIVFSHGTRDQIYLQDGKTLTVEEVSKLDLSKNSPLVFLLSCEGGKPGDKNNASISLAEAFKKAGAKAVLSFEEKVNPIEAINISTEFVMKLHNLSVLDAIEETIREVQRKKGPTIPARAQREREKIKKKNMYS